MSLKEKLVIVGDYMKNIKDALAAEDPIEHAEQPANELILPADRIPFPYDNKTPDSKHEKS
jgi:hypothetical protein